MEEESEQRHKNDIKRRDEARLAGSRLLDTELLKIGAKRQKNAAADPADEQVFPLGTLLLRASRIPVFKP